jgi:ABC-type transport system involved in cytochrome c biogenesis permease subunit
LLSRHGFRAPQNELRRTAIQGLYKGVNERMKTFFWVAGAVCGAVAGVMIWNRQRGEPVDELAHRLESAWADHHTVV